MIYKLCPHEIGESMIELDSTRAEIEREVQENSAKYQRFGGGRDSGSTGNIFVWAIEYTSEGGRERATAALYPHRELGLIWIDLF